jgi:hypothetical protein
MQSLKDEINKTLKPNNNKESNIELIANNLNQDDSMKGEMITMNERIERAKKLPPRKLIFGEFVADKEVTFIAGMPNVAKTPLTVGIANAIGNGESYLNEKNEMKPSKVLIYDLELKEHHISDRYRNFKFSENVFVNDSKTIIEKYETAFSFEIMEKHIDFYRPEFIVIDNLGFLNDKAMQDQETALQTMKILNNLCKTLSIGIIVVAHTPKIDMKTKRTLNIYDVEGSSKIVNYADNIVLMGKTNDMNIKYIKQGKLRSTSETKNIKLVETYRDQFSNLLIKDLGYTIEDELFQNLNYSKETTLFEIAYKYFQSSIGYNEFITTYCKENFNDKGEYISLSRAKQIHKDIKGLNLIIQDDKGKWLFNRNESKVNEKLDDDSKNEDVGF